MLISRRGFLALIGAAGAELILSPANILSNTDNIYSDKKYGFSLVKPNGWGLYSVSDLPNIKISEEYEPYTSLQAEYTETPIMIIGAGNSTANGYIPSIQALATPKDSYEIDFIDLCNLAPSEMSKVYYNYEQIHDITEFSINNCSAAEFSYTFMLTNSGLSYPILMNYVFIEINDHILIFAFESLIASNKDIKQQLMAAKHSLNIWNGKNA